MANAASITGEEQRGLLQTVWCLFRGRAVKATATRVTSHWARNKTRNGTGYTEPSREKPEISEELFVVVLNSM